MKAISYHGAAINQDGVCHYVAVPAQKKDILYLDKELDEKLSDEARELIRTIFIPTKSYTGPDKYPFVERINPQGRSSDVLIEPVHLQIGNVDYIFRVHNVKGCGGPIVPENPESVFYASEWGALKRGRAFQGEKIWKQMRGIVYCEPVASILYIPEEYRRNVKGDFVNQHRFFDSNIRDIDWQTYSEIINLIKPDGLISRRIAVEEALAKLTYKYKYSFSSTMDQNRTYLGMILDIIDYCDGSPSPINSLKEPFLDETRKHTLDLEKMLNQTSKPF